MTNLIGQSLGRYHILEQLGEGGMAVVYKAFDTRLERNVAVKVIRRDAFPADQMGRILKRFQREAKVLASLAHPNIVKVLDSGEEDGIPYLVMEYITGGTLKAVLNARRGAPFDWREAAEWLAPIARALEYAHRHEARVIHRDVKPANVLVSQHGVPMLSDFGIAKVLETEETFELTATGVGIGTPEYMAPEQGTGKNVDHRADIYAMGVMLFEMITGQKPYHADTPMAVMIMKATEPLPHPTNLAPNLPESVDRILFKALEKNPNDRYSSMGEFADILEKMAQGFLPEHQTQPGDGRIKSNWMIYGAVISAIGILCVAAVAGLLIVRTLPLNTPLPTAVVVAQAPTYSTSFPIAVEVTITSAPVETGTPTRNGDGSASNVPIDGMIMLYVPEGEFLMGATDADRYANPNEKPQRRVYLDAYWIDKTEVTNAMFAQFVETTDYRTDAERIGNGTILNFNQAGSPWVERAPGVSWRNPRYSSDSISGLDNHPVVQVSWNDALAYCQWAGRRLPTEAEWEKAARGVDGRHYPWGNEPPGIDLLNYNRIIGRLTEAGSYPMGASPFGALDMLGNAYEWVFDYYDPRYYDNSPSTNPQGPASGGLRVIRGGSWNYGLEWTRLTSRSKLEATYRVENLGFRCAMDAP